jgi:hypothetical protein
MGKMMSKVNAIRSESRACAGDVVLWTHVSRPERSLFLACWTLFVYYRKRYACEIIVGLPEDIKACSTGTLVPVLA